MSCAIFLALIPTGVASSKFDNNYCTINNSENKIDSKIQDLISNGSQELYPTIIWTNEIIESEIEKQIKDEVGYNRNSLEEEYDLPSEELLSELENASNEAPSSCLGILMEKHIELTEAARKVEKEKTDEYREARRNIVKKVNSSKMSSLLEELNIEMSKTVFISKYAPMAICLMTDDDIFLASKNEKVKKLSLYEPQSGTDCLINFGNTKGTMAIDKINNYLSLTGSGVKIGIYESFTVSPSFYSTYGLSSSQIHVVGNYYNPDNGYHSTYCAGVAAGSNGIAPNASIYSASASYDWMDYVQNGYHVAQLNNLEQLIDNGVDLISISWGFDNAIDCYNDWAKYMDDIITASNTTMVCATGNYNSSFILNPSSAYNCIAVNGFDDEYNGQPQEYLHNYLYNNGNGCLKPDVIGPSLQNGTSTSTPYIAGMIALMYEYKPCLSAFPELSKAILMASCHRKCSKVESNNTLVPLYETMQQGLTDRQGAGIPDLYKMISIVSQHTYGNGILNSSNSYERVVHFVQPTYNSESINVSMAYLQNNVPTGSGPGMIDDYNLSVTNDNTTNTSSNTNSSTEMVYSLLTSNDEYLLRIFKNSGQSSNIRYAYAWSTNNEHFDRSANDEGVYYLKNKKSAYYLTKNNYDNRCTQKSFSPSYKAIWVIDYVSSTNTYKVKNSYIKSYGLCLDTVINGNNYYAVDNSTTTVNPITVSRNDNDGTYSFKQTINGVTYALGVYLNSTSQNATVCWSPYSSYNESQRWYLEAANYRIGDVCFDSVINNSDVYAIQSYDAGLNSLNNLEMYLADVNKNDIVTIADAVALSQILANP